MVGIRPGSLVGRWLAIWFPYVLRTGVPRRSAGPVAVSASGAVGVHRAGQAGALQLTHRAHVHFGSWKIENFEIGKIPTVTFDVLNSGLTAAQVVSFRATILADEPLPPEPAFGGPPRPNGALVRPNSADTEISFEFESAVTARTHTLVASGSTPVSIWGELIYRDIFDVEHRTGFGMECRMSDDGEWQFRLPAEGRFNYAD